MNVAEFFTDRKRNCCSILEQSAHRRSTDQGCQGHNSRGIGSRLMELKTVIHPFLIPTAAVGRLRTDVQAICSGFPLGRASSSLVSHDLPFIDRADRLPVLRSRPRPLTGAPGNKRSSNVRCKNQRRAQSGHAGSPPRSSATEPLK